MENKSDLKPNKNEIDLIVELLKQGNFDLVIKKIDKLIKKFPHIIYLYNIFGIANAQRGNFLKAKKSFKKALEINPDYIEVLNNLGNVLREQGDLTEAMKNFKQILKINPNHVEALNNLGSVHRDRGNFINALEHYKKALLLKPDYIDALNNLGNVLRDQGDLSGALGNYQKALSFNTSNILTLNNLGNIFTEKGNLESAIKIYKRALEINPNYILALYNLANAQRDQKDFDSAKSTYQKVLDLKPDYIEAINELLYLCGLICDWKLIKKYQKQISKIGLKMNSVNPYAFTLLEDNPNNHFERSKNYAKKNYNKFFVNNLKFNRRRSNKIRLGYFSADFGDHPITHLILRLFELHNQKEFITFGFSYGNHKNTKFKERLKNAFTKFFDVQDLADINIAKLSREHKIDIAIDLTGYTKNTRLKIFAFGAAPIQVHYLGYPGTLGTSFIDYIIADKTVIPNEQRSNYSEKIIYMPNCFMVNDNTKIINESKITRNQEGIPKDSFVFCCFNKNNKIRLPEFIIWMRLLNKIHNSVLWLADTNKLAKKNLINEAVINKVKPERIIFAKRTKLLSDHLTRYRLADLFLDTFNYNAHTTASDALWAGLPVITKLGKGFAARVAGSLLNALDLSELITTNDKDYESLILELVNNPQKLLLIKNKLNQNRLSTSLFNTELFAKNIENAYFQIYKRYIDSKKPKDINIAI